jgi:hypothetical protein
MKNTDFTEQWTAMQKMTSAISAPLRENARRFWENQDKLLDSMQTLANGWCGACRTGTHVAREAAERMCETQTFVDLIQTYQNWAGGAFERIMADGLACQLAGELASPPLAPSASKKEIEPVR